MGTLQIHFFKNKVSNAVSSESDQIFVLLGQHYIVKPLIQQ